MGSDLSGRDGHGIDKMFPAEREWAKREAEQEKQRSENEWILRRLLWEHHGCHSQYLYGDDGELQCHNQEHEFPFGIDFRRDSVRLIEWKLMNKEGKAIIPRPTGV